MAAAGAVVGAVGSIAQISQKNKQAREQREQIAIQQQSVRDQKILSQYQIDEQRRQLNAASERERLLGLQQQTLALAANDMQATQQRVAQTQAQIATDQTEFQNNQRAMAKEAQANMAAIEQMQQLQKLAKQGKADGAKTEQEANAINAQRLLLQGVGASDSQSGQVFLERVMNAVANGAIDNTSMFNSEMDDATRQLLYEQGVAGLEQKLGQLGVNDQRYNVSMGGRLNEMQRGFNTTNINTQAERNVNARDYEVASKRAQLNINQASNNTQADSQLSALNAQSNSIKGAGFMDYLSAAGNLGMGLMNAGVFGGGGAPAMSAPSSQPYSIFGGATRLTPMSNVDDYGFLSSGKLGLGGCF